MPSAAPGPGLSALESPRTERGRRGCRPRLVGDDAGPVGRGATAGTGSGRGADRMPIAGFPAPSPVRPDRPPHGSRHPKIQFTDRFP